MARETCPVCGSPHIIVIKGKKLCDTCKRILSTCCEPEYPLPEPEKD